jgi:hypothetical protein
MYKTSRGIKFCEEDSYSEGCLPESGFVMDIDVYFEGKTTKEILEKMSDFHDAEINDLELNACDENGRVDIHVMENRDSYKPSNYEIEQWKNGRIKLYSSIYTYRIFKCSDVKL